ncbi:hypothetical protein HMPREF0534_1133, partial [Limosilactobacillus reuteri CF48-3A]
IFSSKNFLLSRAGSFSFTLLPNLSFTYILSYTSNEVLNEKEVHL